MEQLPKELLISFVFVRFSVADVLRCHIVCKAWNKIFDSNILWQNMCNRDYSDLSVYQEQIQSLSSKSNPPKNFWKGVYIKFYDYQTIILTNLEGEVISDCGWRPNETRATYRIIRGKNEIHSGRTTTAETGALVPQWHQSFTLESVSLRKDVLILSTHDRSYNYGERRIGFQRFAAALLAGKSITREYVLRDREDKHHSTSRPNTITIRILIQQRKN
eukprot:TRINITY_DN2671_c0_g3_i1.p1 TRINITY_DN2671_c0_g3~~TRINITY_DN2671_c0_g3_i1.p1  ORF type:complete len:218 (+),score=12.82 TRINITY_DN2671_c0_g3_i1:41-694(+)